MTIRSAFRRWGPSIAAAATALAVAACAYGHELPDNRATLVLRDDRHVGVTVYLNLPEALRKALAHDRSFAEFVLVYSAMDPIHFKVAMDDAESRMAKAIDIRDEAGGKALMERWTWPTATETHAELQNLAAQLLVAPKQPPHDDPAEVHGDLVMARKINGLRVKFPQEFDGVLAVSYRPKQVWIEKGRGITDIRF